MTHDEIAELLGAFALDAVSPEESAAIEEHLLECPRCREEVTAHRQVAGVLGSLGGSAPAGLWDRIASELALGSGGPIQTAEPPESESPERRHRRQGGEGRRLRGLALAGLSAAAALAIVVGILSATVVGLNHRVQGLDTAIVLGGVTSQVKAALADPNHQTIALSSATQPWRAEVVLADGEAFLVPAKMPSIPSTQTFQAWAVVGKKYVSLGVIGRQPGDVALELQHGMSQVLVNVEPEGGTPQPTNPPFMAAALPSSV